MKILRRWRRACVCVCLIAGSVSADTRPDSHAPIGVMGDHVHKKGEFMLSYRFMTMHMEGNLDGSSAMSADEVATTALNSFAMPPTLRVVPTKMRMDMHMIGAMYAPSDRVTLMVMGSLVEKEMDHVTYRGMSGANVLGGFTTRTQGIGDTQIAALIALSRNPMHRLHTTLGLSLPTGSLDESDRVLTPMNTRPKLRLPYPMQLGSGTYDPVVGLSYSGIGGDWGWGGQWRSVFRSGENDEDYRLGDEHLVQAWVSRQLHPRLSGSLRVAWLDRDNIEGRDSLIAAPVQTADPNRHKGERVNLSAGLNWLMPGSSHRLAIEVGKAVYQRVDGPQMEADWQFTLGWQWSPEAKN